MNKIYYTDFGKITGEKLISKMENIKTISFKDAMVFFGIIKDDHLSIGVNKKIEEYLVTPRKNFTFSQYSSRGGLMYCRNVGLYRFCIDKSLNPDPDPFAIELSNSVAASLIKSLRHLGLKNLTYIHNYIFDNGKKFAGLSGREYPNCKCVYLFINKEKMPFEKIKKIYKNKKFDNVTDLNKYNLPDNFYFGIVENFAYRWDLEIECLKRY